MLSYFHLAIVVIWKAMVTLRLPRNNFAMRLRRLRILSGLLSLARLRFSRLVEQLFHHAQKRAPNIFRMRAGRYGLNLSLKVVSCISRVIYGMLFSANNAGIDGFDGKGPLLPMLGGLMRFCVSNGSKPEPWQYPS